MLDTQLPSSSTLATNTSGEGPDAFVPPAIPRRNWAPTILGPIWFTFSFPRDGKIYNQIAKLRSDRWFSIYSAWDMGSTGNALSWQFKRWSSLEAFISVQKRWSFAALTLLIVLAANILFLLFMLVDDLVWRL